MKNNLLNKFLQFSYGSLVGLILGVVTTIITTRLIEPEDLGKVSMFELFLNIGLILTIFGSDQAFIRFFYEEKPDLRGTLLYNSLRIPFITSIFIISIIFVLYKPISKLLLGETNIIFVIFLTVGIILQLLFRFGQLVIRMEQKGNVYSLLQIIQRVFNLFFIILFYLIYGSSFEILVFSNIFTLILLSVITIYIGKEFWHIKNIKNKNAKHSQIDILRYGSPFVMTIFITWLFESFDKIALRQWSTFEELGLYTAAMKLVALVSVLKTTFSTFWTPIAYEKFENNQSNKIFFEYMSSLVAFIMFFVAIISIAGRDIIVLLLGFDYRMSALIMPFLVMMPILYTISETTVIGINFYKKTQWHIIIAVISSIVNIVGNYLLVPKYGAIGASVSTTFAYIIFFTLRTQISLKYYKVNYPVVKIYSMIIVVLIYASYAIVNTNFLLNLLFSIIPIAILFLLFYKDLRYIYKNRVVWLK